MTNPLPMAGYRQGEVAMMGMFLWIILLANSVQAQPNHLMGRGSGPNYVSARDQAIIDLTLQIHSSLEGS